MTDELGRLIAESQIRRTLATYCQSIDDGKAAELSACFTPDAELSAFGRTTNGAAEIAAGLVKLVGGAGKHLITNSIIEFDQDAAARATVISDFLFYTAAQSMVGRYVDDFVAVDGAWLLARKEIVLPPA